MEEFGGGKLRRTLEYKLIFAVKVLLPSCKDLGTPRIKTC